MILNILIQQSADGIHYIWRQGKYITCPLKNLIQDAWAPLDGYKGLQSSYSKDQLILITICMYI